MVSEFFKELEDRTGNHFTLQHDLVNEIAHKMREHNTVIEQALYSACVATGARVMEATVIVNEFLAALREAERPEGKEQTK